MMIKRMKKKRKVNNTSSFLFPEINFYSKYPIKMVKYRQEEGDIDER